MVSLLLASLVFMQTLAQDAEAPDATPDATPDAGTVLETTDTGDGDGDSTATTETVWTPGRITQVTLAIVESTLLTLLLIYPGVMDPIVNFINSNIGSAGSRKRRETRAAMMEHAEVIHNLFLDAIDSYENINAVMSAL